MYVVSNDKTSIAPIQEVNFSDINMKEKEHIQKCIISHPEILGEDLLIIQEEFAKFEGTKERFDLLALDKKGNLVVIENKRDDSGADVTWQAVKYASYCSTLSRSNVLTIFEQYLRSKKKCEKSPEDIISDFLNDNDQSDEEINYPSDIQRIILVSHNFRSEVLSAVQWLINQRLDITCVQLKPYKKKDGEILLDSDVILPQKALRDYALKIAEKKEEKQRIEEDRNNKKEANKKFWKTLDDLFDDRKKTAFKNVDFAGEANKKSYMTCSTGILSRVMYNLVVNHDEVRIELYINTGNKTRNKQIFDNLSTAKENIGSTLQKYKMRWERLDNKDASRISIYKQFNFSNEDDWEKICAFLITGFTDFSNAIETHKRLITSDNN